MHFMRYDIDDLNSKLIKQIHLLPEKKRHQLNKGPCMYDQRFVDLTVRINQPYWLLHQGTCEHFLVIDCIRYDPIYPYQKQQTNNNTQIHIHQPQPIT